MKQLLQKLENSLKLVDIYGQNIQLNLNKKYRYNTVFGGLLSIFIFVLLLIGCWFFGKELIYKKNPTVISQQRVVDCPRRIDVRPDNLIMMMGVANENSQYFSDPSIFTVHGIQQNQISYQDPITGKQTIQLVNKNLDMRLCRESDIGIEETKDYFKQLNYPVLYCFDNSKEDVFFEGDFNQKSFSLILVYFQQCQNTTSSQIICKPKEVIQNKLLQTRVAIFMSDQTIDPLNFQKPIATRGISLYAPTSSNFPQEIGLYFTNQYLDTDSGAFYSDLHSESTFAFAYQTVTPFFGDPNTLVRLQIRLQKQKENYMKRTYLKLAEVVAQIGGLLKILILLGLILSSPITKLYYFKAIIDEIYQFQSPSDKVELVSKDQEMQKRKPLEEQKQTLKEQEEKNQIMTKKLQSKSIVNQKDKKLSPPNKKCSISTQQFEQQNPFQFINQQETKSIQNVQINSNNNNNNLMNTIFDNTNQNTQINNNNDNNLLNATFENTNQNSQINNNSLMNSILDKAKYYFQSTHKILKYSFSQYFSFAFTPKSKISSGQGILFDQSIEKLQENLDILYIFNKLFEIDKLKQILFNPNQLKLFEYMPKPIISEQSIFHSSREIQNIQNLNNASILRDKYDDGQFKQINKKVEAKLGNTRLRKESELSEEALQGLKSILQQNKFSKIDQNLIQIIDPSIVDEIKKVKHNCLNNSLDNDSIFQLIKSNTITAVKPTANHKKGQEQLLSTESKQKCLKILSQNTFSRQQSLFKELFTSTTQNENFLENKRDQIDEKEIDDNYEGTFIDDNQIYFVDQDDISYQTNIQSLHLSVIRQKNEKPLQKQSFKNQNQEIK